jgi:hypothetical protein
MVCGTEMWQKEWAQHEQNLLQRFVDASDGIAAGEARGVAMTAALFAHGWRKRVVEFRCDNTNVCTAVNTGKCKNKRVRELVMWLAHFATQNNFQIFLRYVPSKDNPADLPSRKAASEISSDEMLRIVQVSCSGSTHHLDAIHEADWARNPLPGAGILAVRQQRQYQLREMSPSWKDEKEVEAALQLLPQWPR